MVVLVHDGVLDSAAWDDVWPAFCKHFHAIRYDRRGYGRSPAATQGHYATDGLAAILHHLKLKRVAIVGSSHGGEISINFTLDHPVTHAPVRHIHSLNCSTVRSTSPLPVVPHCALALSDFHKVSRAIGPN